MLLAPYCRKNGLNVFLVTNHHKNLKINDSINQIPIVRINIGNDHKLLNRISGPLNFILHLIKSPKPSIIRFRGISFRIFFIIKLIKVFFPKIKIIVQPAMYGGDDAFSIKKKRFGKYILKQLHKVDLVFAMNELIKKSYYLNNFKLNKIKYVENPVDDKRFKPLNDNEKSLLRKKLRIREDSFIFITSGVISERKRQSFITDAFIECSFDKRILLLHMGPKSSELSNDEKFSFSVENNIFEENKIEKKIQNNEYYENIKLLGNQKNPETYLKIADVFIHASLFEGKANVINEALACGLPIIVPNIKLYKSYLPKSCACFFSPFSESSLAEKMKMFISTENLTKKMSAKSVAYTKNNLNIDIVSKNYSFLIENLLNQKK